MNKFWFGQTKNNKQIMETVDKWNDIKDQVVKLGMNNNGQIIELPSSAKYIQGKTASAALGSNNISIESRFLGFFIENNIVKVTINEKTNNIKIEVIPSENAHFTTTESKSS